MTSIVSRVFLGLEPWLRRRVTHKELGWKEIGEKFTRFVLLKTRWLSVYLHKLDAPVRHPQCHDHPWHFWVLVLGHGYYEEMRGRTVWRRPGSVLYRPAASLHNTITVAGRPNWSVIVVSGRKRDWGMRGCDDV